MSNEDSLSQNLGIDTGNDDDELFLSAYESHKLHAERSDEKEEDIFTEAYEYPNEISYGEIMPTISSNQLDSDDISARHESRFLDSQYCIEVSVRDPKKVGDGLNSYIIYKLVTKTNIPEYRSPHSEVYRRFSDFLGLHSKLVEKHLHHGTIIPPPPEKNVFGTTKIKISKEDASTTDFVEHRRISLERFMRCLSRHPILRVDPAFVDFLELEGDLPRSTSTSAISSSQVLKLLNKVGEGIGKISYKIDEADQCSGDLEWFEDKYQQIEMIESHLKRLYNNIEPLLLHRKDLAQNAGLFSKSLDLLATSEEHASLSRALSRLADMYNRTEQLCLNQSDNDSLIFTELFREYLGLYQSAKEIFQERLKLYRVWKDEEVILKKELKTKSSNKSGVSGITEVEKCKDEFEATSKNVMDEMERFDITKLEDFKCQVIQYFDSLRDHQLQVAQLWEVYLSELNSVI